MEDINYTVFYCILFSLHPIGSVNCTGGICTVCTVMCVQLAYVGQHLNGVTTPPLAPVLGLTQ